MHDFLRAVGFKNIKDQKELDELLQSIVSSPTNYMSARDSEGNEYAEFTKEFADSMGIIVENLLTTTISELNITFRIFTDMELLHRNRQKYKSMQKKNLMPESVMRFV